ncbi:MAG TPA: ABC transporter permease [Firmicutes bacterium]|nr:ABC transporter permease [Bacillota bacterium]
MSRVSRNLQEIIKYPSAIFGLLIIFLLVVIAIYTLATMSYQEAINRWRGDETMWAEYPRNALPSWMNYFTQKKLPTTMVLDTATSPQSKERLEMEGLEMVTATLTFDYQFDDFPSEVAVFFTAKGEGEPPFVMPYWEMPDGRRIELEAQSISRQKRYFVSLDNRLIRSLGNRAPEEGLFLDPAAAEGKPAKGQYKLIVEGYLFEPGGDFDVKLLLYGKVHGMAGTDHRRRDLMIALLWGTPIALCFGLLAALGTTIATFIIAAIGVWYGKWVDALIQRITEVNMILPTLPILIMVGTFYSRSIWMILGVVIALSIFGGGIKTYRAMFLQIKDAPYIEAGRAYGAGNLRLIFRYMIPRMIPVLIPTFVTLIPSYVFLEASLAVLGLGDPILPTWGKLLQDAQENGALFKGYYYWVLQPSALLMLTGLGFAMLGFALDRIYNPRLRGR